MRVDQRHDYADNDLPPSAAEWVQSRAAAIGFGMLVVVVAYFVAAVVIFLLTPAW